MTLLRQIELFLRKTELAPTTFGRRSVRDPRLVFDLRNGRQPGAKLAARVKAWMQGYSA